MFGLASPVYAQGIQEWGTCVVDGVPTLKCFEVLFGNVIFMASTLIVFLLFIMIVIGAFQYLTSFGDPGKLKKAQATLRYAIAGFFLFLASFIIIKVIDTLFLGGTGALFKLNLEQ
jgi:uncharacterized membrane protein HdeD (DUF308 family)